jgi:tripartite-type tricarboxylate transporter receptor subunit TctC
MTVRQIGHGFALLVAICTSVLAMAQEYPTKPIRLLVPFAPGGVVDTSTRILTNKMTERLGWTFVVDNRPGANGFIAVGIVAKAAADGYTLLSGHTGEFSINPAVFKSVPYDYERDFTAITMLSDAAMAVVASSASGIGSFKDLVAMAKAKPGQLTFGSPGAGSVNHLAAEWLAFAAGIKVLHVPYKGGAPAVAAAAGGEVAFTVAGIPGVTPHLKSGRIRVIGVTTAKRSPHGPDWMTPQEAGIRGVDASIWVGIFAPKGVPKPVVDKLYTEIAATLKNAEVRERYATVGGAETVGMPPAEFHARVLRDLDGYRKVVRDVGLKPQ